MATADLDFDMEITGTPQQIVSILEIMFEYSDGKDDVYFSFTTIDVGGNEFSLMQRCGAHIASATDISESFMSGKAAVEYAVDGITDKMVGFERHGDEFGNYVCGIKLMDSEDLRRQMRIVQAKCAKPNCSLDIFKLLEKNCKVKADE